MDQLKEVLQQAIKYRFWIAVGIAPLFFLIAYFAGTGDLTKAEQAETAKIKAADQKVKPYVNGQIYNGDWTNAVKEKTDLLTSDVNASWLKLYNVQAPLLTWPKEVETRIPVWGSAKWPEGVDVQQVNSTINDYILVYPRYVTEVYKSFQPFDPADGKGIVAAPPEKDLLQSAEFSEASLPSLGKVWSAQYKLWIQRTLLDIVNRVNTKAKAKDWDSAPIKQIASLEVASILAQDQKSMAKGEVLKEMPDIVPPGSVAPAASEPAAPGGAARSASLGTIQYISAPGEDQFTIVPVAMTVYIDQDRINEFLVEFQNSPMAIQIMDFEIRPTSSPVVKPVKGMAQSTFGGSMGGGMAGYGMGNDSSRFQNAGRGSMPSSYGNLLKGGSSLGRGGYGMPGGPGTKKSRQGGKDVADSTLKNLNEKKSSKKDAKDKDKDKEKEDEESATANPYFNVVEVTIKGQARFYKRPPIEATPPVSPGAPTPEPAKDAVAPEAPPTPAAPPAKIVEPEGPPIPVQPPAGATPPTPPADATKTNPAPPEPGRAEPPKAATPTPEPPKVEPPKADMPTPEPPKAEPPKVDPPKGNDAPPPKP